MKSRAILLLMAMAVALVVASGVAWAAQISCPNRSGNLCVGTDDRDTMTGTNSADDMRARGGNDTLKARGGNDKLDGGLGNDSLVEGAGNDTYRFDDGWGADTLDGVGGGVDTLDFSAVSRGVNVHLAQKAGLDEASSGTSKLNITNTDALIENLRGGAGIDFLDGNAANNTLFGNANNDDLGGGEGKDTLLGGTNNDEFEGGLGDDQLKGGEGSDFYRYLSASWGHDTITDTTTADNDLNTYNALYFPTSLITHALTINLLSSSSAPEAYFTGAPSGSETIEWSNSVIDTIYSLARGNDTIDGNASPNLITSHGGNDSISSFGGDDFIDVDDGATGDTVDCGGILVSGNDTVKYDNGDTVTNCEIRYKDNVLQ